MIYYYAYHDLYKNETELFNATTGEIITFKGHGVCDNINLSQKSIVFDSHLHIICRLYLGGSKMRDSGDPLTYIYGNTEFRSFGALFTGQSTSLLSELYQDTPISMAMCFFVEKFGNPKDVKYTLAYHAKKIFYEDIKEELWEDTKAHKHYYHDIKTYKDMMCGNKAGVLRKPQNSIYSKNLLMFDKRSAYPSALVNDDCYPIGKIVEVKYKTLELMYYWVVSKIENREWFKIIIDTDDDILSKNLYFDNVQKKFGLDYSDIVFMYNNNINEFKNVFNAMNKYPYRVYKTQKTGYLNNAFRERIVETYNNKQKLEKGTFERWMNKTMLNMVYGKGLQDYDFTDIHAVVDHYKGRGDNYLTPEMSNHCNAVVRNEILAALMFFGEDAVYYDTDGMEVRESPEVYEYFRNRNEEIKLANIKAGFNSDIGTWDFDGKADKFIAIRAKMYAHEKNGELTLKLAGLGNKEKKKIGIKCVEQLREEGLVYATKSWVVDTSTKMTKCYYIEPTILR